MAHDDVEHALQGDYPQGMPARHSVLSKTPASVLSALKSLHQTECSAQDSAHCSQNRQCQACVSCLQASQEGQLVHIVLNAAGGSSED